MLICAILNERNRMIKRTDLKEHFGGYAKAALALGYAKDKTGANIRRLKDVLNPRQTENILKRMTYAGLPIPDGWKVTEQVIQPVAEAVE